MFDDPATYFYENVMESYTKFLTYLAGEESGFSQDTRHALSAASAVFHLREHLPEQCRPTRADIAGECSAYDILGDVVNASKHGELSHSPKHVARATSIEELTETTKYRDDAGEYFDSRRRVIVKTLDGEEHDVAVLLTDAINYWIAKLHALGILTSSFSLPSPIPRELPTRAEAEARQPRLRMRQGVRFQQRVRLLEYDYANSTTKPWHVDKYEFRMWQPSHAELRVENPRAGLSFTIPIKLTRDEERALEALENDEDRQRLIHEIAIRQGVFAEVDRRIRALNAPPGAPGATVDSEAPDP